MNSRIALLIAVPLIVALVLVLTLVGFFSSEVVIAVLVVLYAVVSLVNRRKFNKQKKAGASEANPTAGRGSGKT
ncbi:MAG: hypothetical protein ACLQEQ_03495 [Nitrososphaerales archaeon]